MLMYSQRECIDVICARMLFLKNLRYRYFSVKVYIALCPINRYCASHGIFFQGTVIDLRNPGEFSIHLQSVEMESLKNITKELQKAYSSSFAAEYKPEIGELCAVKFSLDRVRQFFILF